ncbi:hypothetical protein Tco_1539382 [Tanacetum coccineum]
MFPPLTGCDRLVMSTPAYVDSEITTQADGAQSSRVPVPLPNYPYVAESEAFEPLGTKTDSSHSSALSDSTTPLSPDHTLTHVSPTPTPTRASFHHWTACMIIEGDKLGDEDTDEGREDESSDANDEIEGSDDGIMDKGDEATPEGQQQAISVADTAMGEPLGLGYEALRRRELAEEEDQDSIVYTDIPAYVPPAPPVQTPPSPEWSSISLLVSPAPSTVPSPIPSPMISLIIPSPIASPVATLTATISIDEDQFLKRYRFGSLERKQERTVVMFRALWKPVLTLEAWAGHVDTRMEDMSRAGLLRKMEPRALNQVEFSWENLSRCWLKQVRNFDNVKSLRDL